MNAHRPFINLNGWSPVVSFEHRLVGFFHRDPDSAEFLHTRSYRFYTPPPGLDDDSVIGCNEMGLETRMITLVTDCVASNREFDGQGYFQARVWRVAIEEEDLLLKCPRSAFVTFAEAFGEPRRGRAGTLAEW